ncbi:MAG: hypothetical protein PGN11_05435 [Quadrisphaera sp.]
MTVRVMDGGCTFSWSARARSVCGPRRSRPASTEYCASVMSVLLRSRRRRRARRMAPTRSSAASGAGLQRVGATRCAGAAAGVTS